MFGGSWEKKGSVGEGSFGAVYLVERSVAGKAERAVVKTVFLHSHGEALDPEKVLHEARLLQQLSHPNIVRLLDWTTQDDQVHLLLEYCEGGDLANRLAALKRAGEELAEVTAISYYAQALSALTHLHARNVLHRDIKSANIFLTGADVIKLGDFGASRPLTHTTQLINTVVGTPAYFAPELLVSAPYNRQCDVWALGCVLYEMLALQRPFHSPSFLELAESIMSREPPPLPAHRSPMARQFVAQMLQKDPARRSTLAELGSHPVIAALLAAIDRSWRTGHLSSSSSQLKGDAAAAAARAPALSAADATNPTAAQRSRKGKAADEGRVASPGGAAVGGPLVNASNHRVAPASPLAQSPTPPPAPRPPASGAADSPRNVAGAGGKQLPKAPPSEAAAVDVLSPPRPPPPRTPGSSSRPQRDRPALAPTGAGSSARAAPAPHGHPTSTPAAQPTPAPPPAQRPARRPQPPPTGARSQRLPGAAFLRGIWRVATSALKTTAGRRGPADAPAAAPAAPTPRLPAGAAAARGAAAASGAVTASGARAQPASPLARIQVADEDGAAAGGEMSAARDGSPPHSSSGHSPPAAALVDGARAHTRALRQRNAIRDGAGNAGQPKSAPPPETERRSPSPRTTQGVMGRNG